MKKKTAPRPEGAFSLFAKKQLGQHFLRDEGVVLRIVAAADGLRPDPATRVCHEIGPGTGVLTLPLLRHGWNVLALEKDPRAAAGLRATLEKEYHERFAVREIDLLRWSPETSVGETKPLCVGNLPYYITTDIFLWFCRYHSLYGAGLFMIQDEVADRLVSRPGTKEYGRISARMQLMFRIQKILKVPASAFLPPPKVDSAVVLLEPTGFAFSSEQEEKAWESLTGMLFSARRKMLRRAMVSWFASSPEREAQAEAFWALAQSLGVSPEHRPETLSPEVLLAFHRFFFSVGR